MKCVCIYKERSKPSPISIVATSVLKRQSKNCRNLSNKIKNTT